MVEKAWPGTIGDVEFSEFVDGEMSAEAANTILDKILRDPTWRDRWLAYHRQADAMRFPQPSTLDDGAFLSKFAAGFEAEPAHFPNADRRVVTRNSWRRAWARYGLPSVAVAAAVVAVTWMTLPELISRGDPSFSHPVVALDGGSSASTASDDRDFAQMQEYLLAHQQFAPSSQLHGIAPYVRTAVAVVPQQGAGQRVQQTRP